MDAAEKTRIIEEYATKPGDTGSPDVQIALLTKRIAHLTEHLKVHKGDHHSSLSRLVFCRVFCENSRPEIAVSDGCLLLGII